MAITVVQSKGIAAGNSAASFPISFSSLPTVGNAVIVLAEMCSSGGVGAAGVTDNQSGNTYIKAVQQLDGNNNSNSAAVAIYWCPAIVGSSGTFTVTVPMSNGTNSGWTALALFEVSSLSNTVDQIGGTGVTAVTTGPIVVTAAGQNASANALVVGGCAMRAGADGGAYSAGPTSGYTSLTVYNAGTQGPATTGGYKIVSALETSAMTTPTWTGSATGAAALATFDQFTPGNLIGQTTPTSGNTIGLVAGDMYWITSNAFAGGTATALNACLGAASVPSGLLMGLYDQNGNLLASGTVASPAAGLNTATITSTPIVYGQQYSISVQATTSSAFNMAGNPTGVGPTHKANTPNTVPSVLPGSPFIDAHGVMTLYATGSLSAGASGTPLGGLARTQVHFRGSGMTS